MKPQKIKENIFWVGAVDWDRRLFDSLIQLPDGTSYNSYLVYGKDKTALFDTVDPSKTDILMSNLSDVPNIDFVISSNLIPIMAMRWLEVTLRVLALYFSAILAIFISVAGSTKPPGI